MASANPRPDADGHDDERSRRSSAPSFRTSRSTSPLPSMRAVSALRQTSMPLALDRQTSAALPQNGVELPFHQPVHQMNERDARRLRASDHTRLRYRVDRRRSRPTAAAARAGAARRFDVSKSRGRLRRRRESAPGTSSRMASDPVARTQLVEVEHTSARQRRTIALGVEPGDLRPGQTSVMPLVAYQSRGFMRTSATSMSPARSGDSRTRL